MKQRSRTMVEDSNAAQSLPVPGTHAYEALPQFPQRSPLPFRRTIRRHELHQMVPLAETTIYEMERRGEFPRRFNLTPRCVVWDLSEVESWIEQRKQAPREGIEAGCPPTKDAPCPSWLV